ncbi:MAG: hypothetical protein RIF46_02175, partial [Cyclobacteriaceae bacterium]
MKYTFLPLLLVLLIGCSPYQKDQITWQSIEKDLQLKMIQAEAGEVVELPAGNFMFTKPIIIDGLNNVTIRGAGI